MALLIPAAVVLLFMIFCALMTLGEPLNPTRPLMSYDQAREHARKLARMIQCRTVSHADRYDDAEFEKLRDVMETTFPLVHRHCRKMTFGDDCWIYLLAGVHDDRNILLMAHHDVVDGEGAWTHPAFSGKILDGKLWGRGAVDTKTSLYGMFAALEELLQEGYFPECNIWIGSSCNEEVAGSGIPLAAEYFRAQGITFDLVLDEGGAVIDPPMSGMICPKCAMVAVHEKGRHRLILKASQEQGHNGLAGGAKATPTERMAAFITELRNSDLFIRRMNPQLEGMFRAMTPYMNFSMKLIFANLWCFRPLLVKQLPKFSAQAGGLLGTTCVFNDIQTQNQGKECTAKILLRSVDDADLKQDLLQLEKLAQKHGIEVLEGGESEYHPPADPTLPAFSLVRECIRTVFPDVPVVPFILPAGTDGRHLTELCPCVLRFAPLRLTAQQLASVHGPDENIDITAIGACVSFYRCLLKKYASSWEEEAPAEGASVEELPGEETIAEEIAGDEIHWEEIAGDEIHWEEITGEEIPLEEMNWEELIGDVFTEENPEEETEYEQSEE